MTLLQDRMRRPLHLGPPDGANRSGAVGNPACGDVLTLHLCIDEGRIVDAGFDSIGSAFQLATASVLCDCVTGQAVDEALQRTPDCVLKRLPDLPQRHRYLARLGIDALRKALTEAPTHAPATEVDEAGAKAFVRRILGNGQAWTTQAVAAMAEAEAIDLPAPAARLLADLAKNGVVVGEMDVARKAMVWRLNRDRPTP